MTRPFLPQGARRLHATKVDGCISPDKISLLDCDIDFLPESHTSVHDELASFVRVDERWLEVLEELEAC